VDRQLDVETLIIVTDCWVVADLGGFTIAAGPLLNIWLWTASLRREWRVVEDVVVDDEDDIAIAVSAICCYWFSLALDFEVVSYLTLAAR
jgi:hypothetical protein